MALWRNRRSMKLDFPRVSPHSYLESLDGYVNPMESSKYHTGSNSSGRTSSPLRIVASGKGQAGKGGLREGWWGKLQTFGYFA